MYTKKMTDCSPPPAHIAPADQTGFIVVGSVIRGSRVRNLNRQKWNVCLAILSGDDRRHVFVGLELDHQIHFASDQQIGIALSGFGIVLVVNGKQLNSFRGCCTLQAFAHISRELVIGSLCGITEAVQFRFEKGESRIGTGSHRFCRPSRIFRACIGCERPLSWASRFALRSREEVMPPPRGTTTIFGSYERPT